MSRTFPNPTAAAQFWYEATHEARSRADSLASALAVVEQERDQLLAWKQAVLEHGLCAHKVPINERCAECDSDFERDYPGVLARAALAVPSSEPAGEPEA